MSWEGQEPVEFYLCDPICILHLWGKGTGGTYSSQHVLLIAIWEWRYYVHLMNVEMKVRDLEQLVEYDTWSKWQSWDSNMGLSGFTLPHVSAYLSVLSFLLFLGEEVSLLSKAHLCTCAWFPLCILNPPFSTNSLPSACPLIFANHHLKWLAMWCLSHFSFP